MTHDSDDGMLLDGKCSRVEVESVLLSPNSEARQFFPGLPDGENDQLGDDVADSQRRLDSRKQELQRSVAWCPQRRDGAGHRNRLT